MGSTWGLKSTIVGTIYADFYGRKVRTVQSITANCIIIDHFSAFEPRDWSPRFSTLRDKNGWVRAKTARI